MSLRALLAVCLCLGTLACARTERFLMNAQTSSPILELAVPRGGAQCSARHVRLTVSSGADLRAEVCDGQGCTPVEIGQLTFRDRSGPVPVGNLRLGSGNVSEGPVTPVEGPDGLLWLCREDEDAQQCICIPWFQD
jgi:hypothetical protein